MKTKRSLINALLVTILIYIGISWVSDFALYNSQKSHFITASDSFIELNSPTNKKALKVIEDKNDLVINTLDLEKKSPQKLNDLWNKEIIQADKKVTKTSRLTGRTFYRAKELSDHKYLIIRHFSKRLWNHHMAYFGLLSIIYVLLAIIINWYIYNYRTKKKYELEAITDNLKKIGEGKEITPMIVHPNDELDPFIQEVKNVEKMVLDNRQHTQLLSRRFKGLVGHLPVGIMLLNDQGNVIMHNQAMSVILGQNISDEIHPFIDDIKTYSLSRMIEHTLRKNKNYHRTLELVSGSKKYVDASVIRIAHSSEDLEHQVIVILYDLTKGKKIEQMQADFVSNVSHELKTPITAINGFVETLQNGAKDNPEDLTKFLNIIENEGKRLNSIVEDILNLSEIDNNDDFSDVFSLKELIDQISTRLQKPMETKNIRLSVNVLGRDQIKSSKTLIEEILNNLLVNAVLYNKEDGSVDVKINHDEVENNLSIEVTDTGIGISDADTDRIFERFYRVDKAHSQEIAGTGLGLAIVSDAVEELNGSIQVDSQLTVGTKFIINIPL